MKIILKLLDDWYKEVEYPGYKQKNITGLIAYNGRALVNKKPIIFARYFGKNEIKIHATQIVVDGCILCTSNLICPVVIKNDTSPQFPVGALNLDLFK